MLNQYIICKLCLGENFHDYVMLLKVYQATMTLYPGGYKGSLPKNEFLNKAIELYQQNIDYFPLKAPLEQGLGGEDYVLTGVRSKLGHFIGLYIFEMLCKNVNLYIIIMKYLFYFRPCSRDETWWIFCCH